MKIQYVTHIGSHVCPSMTARHVNISMEYLSNNNVLLKVCLDRTETESNSTQNYKLSLIIWNKFGQFTINKQSETLEKK